MIELMAVLVIIAVLALLIIGTFEQIRRRSERAYCTQNLRNLYTGLASYTTQYGHWPQCPHKLGSSEYDQWWMDELARVGINEKTWQCPTLTRENQAQLVKQDHVDLSKKKKKELQYMPTNFDEKPSTPYKWPTQPWLIEVYGGHGNGALMIFPDGSVAAFNEFLRRGR